MSLRHYEIMFKNLMSTGWLLLVTEKADPLTKKVEYRVYGTGQRLAESGLPMKLRYNRIPLTQATIELIHRSDKSIEAERAYRQYVAIEDKENFRRFLLDNVSIVDSRQNETISCPALPNQLNNASL